MENRYFTPEIEDIHIGYQCEILWNQNMLSEDNWYKIEIGDNQTKDFDFIDYIERIENSKLRVPYLTKEQIEKEGWIFTEKGFNKDNIYIKTYKIENKV